MNHILRKIQSGNRSQYKESPKRKDGLVWGFFFGTTKRAVVSGAAMLGLFLWFSWLTDTKVASSREMGSITAVEFIAKNVSKNNGKTSSTEPFTVATTDSGKVILRGGLILRVPQKVVLRKTISGQSFLCGDKDGCVRVAE